jgi:hypothetical protein
MGVCSIARFVSSNPGQTETRRGSAYGTDWVGRIGLLVSTRPGFARRPRSATRPKKASEFEFHSLARELATSSVQSDAGARPLVAEPGQSERGPPIPIRKAGPARRSMLAQRPEEHRHRRRDSGVPTQTVRPETSDGHRASFPLKVPTFTPR